MELKGTISSVGLPFILQTLSMGKETGTLNLKTESEKGEIILKDGNIIFASSSRQKVRLGEILVNQGKISEEEISEILEQQKGGDKKFGEILKDSGKVTEEEIAKCLNYQAEEVIFQLLSWTDGNYNFEEDEIPEDILSSLGEHITSLISEGKESIEELLRIRETIPSLELVLELQTLPEDRDNEIDLTIDEWHILSMIDGERSVADVCVMSPANTFTTCRILNNLITFKVVQPTEVKLFDESGDDSSKRLLKMTTMMAIFNQAIMTVYKELSEKTGDMAIRTLRQCLRLAKDNYPATFKSLDFDQHGSLDHVNLMHNILELSVEQQVPALRNGLNNLLGTIILRLKDQTGKKKYHLVMKNVKSALSSLIEQEDALRNEIKNNLESVLGHTNRIPSSFKLGVKLLNENKTEEALLAFLKVPETNPNYKKALRHIKQIRKDKPEIEQKPKEEPARVSEPIETIAEAAAIAEPIAPKKQKAKSRVVQSLLKGLKLFSVGNYEEAIELLDKVLVIEPLNMKAAKYRELALQQLANSYEQKIGSLEQVPLLNQDIGDEQLERLTLSPHEGYLLSRVNGTYTINEIMGISGLDRYNSLKIFHFFMKEELIKIARKQPEKEIPVKEEVMPEPRKKVIDTSKLEEQKPKKKKKKKQPKKAAQDASVKLAADKPRGITLDRNQLADGHYKRGMSALKEGDYVRSVEELEAAILNNPNNPMYYSLLAEAREKKRTIESDNSFEAGLIEIRHKNYAKAVRLLKKAVSNSPRNFKYYVTLAEVLMKVPGKKEEALVYFRKALDLDPNNVEIMLKIGFIYKALGQKDLAMRAFRNCLSLDSSNQMALKELRKLQLAL